MDRANAAAKRKGPVRFYTFIDPNHGTLSNMISGFITSSGHEVACSGQAPRSFHKDAFGWQLADFGKQLQIWAQGSSPLTGKI